MIDGDRLIHVPLVQIFLAQTRTARVGMKLARNLAAEVPVITHLFMGLLQAPQQVFLRVNAVLTCSGLGLQVLGSHCRDWVAMLVAKI